MYRAKYNLIHSHEDEYHVMLLYLAYHRKCYVTIKHIDPRTNERSDGRGTDNRKAHRHFNLIGRVVKLISDYAIYRNL